jgi:predicted RNA-binding protein with PUA-like domain
MRVVRSGHPEPADLRWYQVEVQLLARFAHPVTLATLREHAGGQLRGLLVLRRGNRLSITAVTTDEWQFIHHLADANAA